mmetsp:Transcript_6836/g.19079  ORF Transcript_6836/g.19079 Transcript_6836/m.19079 type:complete len:228 (+) Transcript_6836:13-696(+)
MLYAILVILAKVFNLQLIQSSKYAAIVSSSHQSTRTGASCLCRALLATLAAAAVTASPALPTTFRAVRVAAPLAAAAAALAARRLPTVPLARISFCRAGDRAVSCARARLMGLLSWRCLIAKTPSSPTSMAAFLTARRLVGTSSRMRHSNAATGTGPFGRTSTTYLMVVVFSPVTGSGMGFSIAVQSPSNSEKNWESTHLNPIWRCCIPSVAETMDSVMSIVTDAAN